MKARIAPLVFVLALAGVALADSVTTKDAGEVDMLTQAQARVDRATTELAAAKAAQEIVIRGVFDKHGAKFNPKLTTTFYTSDGSATVENK